MHARKYDPFTLFREEMARREAERKASEAREAKQLEDIDKCITKDHKISVERLNKVRKLRFTDKSVKDPTIENTLSADSLACFLQCETTSNIEAIRSSYGYVDSNSIKPISDEDFEVLRAIASASFAPAYQLKF
jgi:hypothetical protein